MKAGGQVFLSEPTAAVVEYVHERLRRPCAGRCIDRPSITLTYAQSLDGSIAARPGEPLPLSNQESRAMTHCLRTIHDGLLVGINTVLADDPQLTVRLVDGRSPRPMVLDGNLRFPLEARLLRPPCVPPIIATLSTACMRKERLLKAAGAQVIRCPARADGLIDVAPLLRHLKLIGINSLMVEGGAQVITSFLAARLADQVVLTVSPRFVGGLRAVKFDQAAGARSSCPLGNTQYHVLAGDLIVCGDFLDDAHHLDALPAARFAAYS